MIRIKLANWYGDHAPGQEVNVSEALLAGLRRDGLVAEVLACDTGPVTESAVPEAGSDVPESAAELRRKRR